ncbi:hypothetical protein AC579_204 [Pseudocercospora musae]|uniref:Methyltransferase type 11 domain-containing protein n=1 Tax=Pseudocercospora musae TaxID=113226 RepID=A0A139I004_9PEZI|nr:hypothetical protein AC579_204 [Pseudocercospora musae]
MGDTAENRRVNEEHDFISSGLGYVLHPTITRSLEDSRGSNSEKLRVADVSQGDQFSATASLPFSPQETIVDQITFQSVIKPGSIPPESRGIYDVVCIRLLHASLEIDQWDEAMQNLVALLKPGAWLQWVDWDPMTARIATVKPGAPDGILRGLLSDYADAMRAAKVGNTYRIANAMRPNLEELDSDMYTIDPSVELSKIIASGAISYLQQNGKYTSAEAQDVGIKTEQEIDQAGSLCFFDLWSHIGRKPVC